MKKILALILVCVMSMTTAVFAADFADMPEDGHWAKAALENAVENGLLAGSNGYVLPNDNMTRAQMATIMVRACGAVKDADISEFTDVKVTDWFYSAMSKAVAMGAFNGSGGKLNPNNNITRQEAFVVLSRVFGLSVNETVDTTVLDQFKDKGKVASWAQKDVAAIISAGYVGGSNGMLNPLANITRAEFAVVMDRLVKYYIDDPNTTTLPTDGNVMLRVGGLKLDGVTTDKLVVVGDGVDTAEMSISNCVLTGPFVIRGGSIVSGKGEFKNAKIIRPGICFSAKPATTTDNNGVHKIYIEEGSNWRMGDAFIGELKEDDSNDTVIDAVEEVTE